MQGIVTCSRAEGKTVAGENNFYHRSAIRQSLSDRALGLRDSFTVRKVNLASSAPRVVLHHKKLFKPAGTWVLQSEQPLELQIGTYSGGKWFAGKQVTFRESTLQENERKLT